jgi:1-acyl-sn-glycerol-3-phosphate acyltransferase
LSRDWLASLIAACARGLAGASVQWINCQPKPCQRVYFANHTSHLDFVVLWSVLPKGLRKLVRPVAAKDYWNSGLRRRLAVNVFHAVLVERHASQAAGNTAAQHDPTHHSLDALVDALGEKNSLIIFPEGTRGTGEVISPFKSGIYYLWRARPDVEFVPAYLANLNRVLPKGEFLPVPVVSRVVFGPPLQLQPDMTKETFIDQAHQAVCALREI